ncbi:secondary thiamine-phosphate synthase enzyme YjbQ [Melioribacteraceae bacterium 4301-Me]|uniref:secondary thiamine-phosphate synthase enzyme YjbQ n=1 Tax=Pyranulibacter aquaticus TaxID=3163344 RepID=UPI00359ABE35
MKIVTSSFDVDTKGSTDLIDITASVQSELKKSGLQEGSALIFVSGSTAGITTIEYEPGLLKDYPIFFEKIIPSKERYYHDETWHDANGYSHIRASLQGASFTVPFNNGQLLLGTWQQIVLIDFDNRPRKRNVIVQLIGQ